ncbi:hypothetical protein Dsin_028279 [Dipteronia sinensis]|uniref:Uncharacterized protein n=1 Tax=Dipteronia sinensis TaxID=43782 RepID=A0AAD9ZQD0_9ROSI|nr:hypothetical protein Dsin_028279 [Dipteronia sinensis]
MTHLSSLENLMLVGCEKLTLHLPMETEEKGNHQDLINSKRPHLRVLYMRKLPHLVEFPQWLLQYSSNTLKWLGIAYCPNFTALPTSLQNLESLQFLGTANCPKLSSLPEDMHCLTALRKLHIKQCGELNVRCQPGTGEDWPQIADIPNIKLDGELIKSSY